MAISTSVLTVSATDGDSGTSGEIVYSITKQAPAPAFRVDSKSGKTIVAMPLSCHMLF